MQHTLDTLAFPTSFNKDYPTEIVGGMTLRDYFAAKILINPYFYNEANVDQVAQWAYRMADAMLEARK